MKQRKPSAGRVVLRRAVLACAVLACAVIAASPAGAQVLAPDPIVEFTVTKADTMIGLSNSVLVSAQAWQEVARLNRLRNPNRIRPGQVLKIPLRLMRSEAVEARLTAASGDVQVAGAVALAGSAITEGQSVQTGEAGSAVIELADGSRMRMPPSSLAEVAASRRYGARAGRADAAASGAAAAPTGLPEPGGFFAVTMRVLRGSVEVFATKVLRAKPLEVVTPTAVVGVRGTQYRVGFDAAAGGLTHSEVLEGAVRFDLAKAPAGADVGRGLGAAIDAVKTVPVVAKLLAAPDLSSVAERFERPLVRIELPADPAVPTTALRVQVAADSAFDKVVSDQKVEAGAPIRIAGLDDAQWHLRMRRIDTQGIEGFDAARAFTLKARPEPPAYRAPRANGKQSVGAVELQWALNTEAPRVRLQVAQDPAFTRIVEDRDNLEATATTVQIAAPGTYHWRLQSVRTSGDHGPFGDPQRFELRPTPTPPAGGPSADGKTLVFTWSGRAEDRQQVQLARDPEFRQIVAQDELAGAEWSLPTPSRSGKYYFRYRSVEPDGFVTPYSSTLAIELPKDWTGLWLLLPLLLLL